VLTLDTPTKDMIKGYLKRFLGIVVLISKVIDMYM